MSDLNDFVTEPGHHGDAYCNAEIVGLAKEISRCARRKGHSGDHQEFRYARSADLIEQQSIEHFAREERRTAAFESIAASLVELVKKKPDVFR